MNCAKINGNKIEKFEKENENHLKKEKKEDMFASLILTRKYENRQQCEPTILMRA